MQIYELTNKKQVELEEGIIDSVKSGIAGAKQGYQTSKKNRGVDELADKAFRAWQGYVGQLEQSIAIQPAPAAGAATTSSTGGQTQKTATGLTHTANANNPNKTATPPATVNATPGTTVPPTTPAPGTTATPAPTTAPATTAAATTPAKPNYGAQTGAGAKVAYNQPTGVPTPLVKTPQPTSRNMVQPPATAPATVGSTAPGQPITVGGQKIKPGQPGYDQLAKATLKELQAPAAAVSPALAAFRNRTDGKYEAYLTAFVQKNLLAGLGFRGLVNQQEITNAIKAIASPENAAPAKQRPLWTDLARATALAVPAAGSLTGRDPKAPKDPNATKNNVVKATNENKKLKKRTV